MKKEGGQMRGWGKVGEGKVEADGLCAGGGRRFHVSGEEFLQRDGIGPGPIPEKYNQVEMADLGTSPQGRSKCGAAAFTTGFVRYHREVTDDARGWGWLLPETM